MVTIDLKGIAKVKAKGKDYYYAWRGGPRLRGEPGSPEFQKSYNEAIESRRTPDASRLRALVTLYKGSTDFTNLAASTRKQWAPWLDRISTHFGGLRIAMFDRPEKIRLDIRKWRSKWADKPRTADYGMQVLSRVLSHGVEIGKLASNPCEGIKQLYDADRSEIIWTESDIAQLKRFCSPDVAQAVDLAAYTGLRLGDLLKLSWSHIRDDAIEMATSKSRKKREAVVPLYDALRETIADVPKRSTTILTNSRNRPWTRNGFGTAFNRAKHKAGMADLDLHFHDLRGTAATRFYLAGLEDRVIAEIMGWEEEQVRRIIRRYVERNAAIRETIARINKATPRRRNDSNVVPLEPERRFPGRGVYFIACGNRVKIGWSGGVNARLRALRTTMPERLHLLHVVPGTRADELRFHQEFAEQRMHGEWFRLEGGLAAFLRPFIDRAAESSA